MNLIASADKNWAIGKDNKLLVRVPEDMKFFRRMTTGKVVVMGRKTLDSFPGGKPLKNRVNLVLTKNPDFHREGVLTAGSVKEALERFKGQTEKTKKPCAIDFGKRETLSPSTEFFNELMGN